MIKCFCFWLHFADSPSSVSPFSRTMSLWMNSIISRAFWRRGCRVTHPEALPSPARTAWRGRAAPVEARSVTALYRTPALQHTCSLWRTRTHTSKACRSSAPSTSSPSAPGNETHFLWSLNVGIRNGFLVWFWCVLLLKQLYVQLLTTITAF